MSKLNLFIECIRETLTTATLEIFGAVEKTFAEFQDEINNSKEEIARLKRLLDIVTQPEIKIQRTGSVNSSNATYALAKVQPTANN